MSFGFAGGLSTVLGRRTAYGSGLSFKSRFSPTIQRTYFHLLCPLYLPRKYFRLEKNTIISLLQSLIHLHLLRHAQDQPSDQHALLKDPTPTHTESYDTTLDEYTDKHQQWFVLP